MQPHHIYDNILLAKKDILRLNTKAPNILGVLPPHAKCLDPFTVAGVNLSENDFIVTRIIPNHDDVEYGKILAIDDEVPFLTDYKRYSLKPNTYHTNFLYRGQRKDWRSIKPNLFRDGEKKYFLDDMIRMQEMSAFIAQHPLVQLLGIKGIELRGKPIKFQCNLYGLAQHYYNKTSEVDFSSSVDVASFFAVTEYDTTADVYKPLKLTHESIGVIYILGFDSSLSYNNIFGFPITSIGKQYCFKRPELQLGFLVDVNLKQDLINHPYLRSIKFRHNPQIAQRIYNEFEQGLKIAPHEPLEQYWRETYDNNKSEPFEISNKALQLNLFMNQEETLQSIIEKLRIYKNDDGSPTFKLSNLEWPYFPQEMLDSYYKDIRNGWWQDDFCANIYFIDGSKNKEALLRLPNDPRYRKYFYC